MEAVGRVVAVACKGRPFKLTNDGYWVNPSGLAGFNLGMTCTVRADFKRVVKVPVPGALFQG